MNPRAVLKLNQDRPDLHMAAGDFLISDGDGTPIAVVRKLDADRAAQYAEALNLPGPSAVRGGAE